MSSGEVKRGRPLDPEIDDAIVAAAGAMLREGGLQRMTMPGRGGDRGRGEDDRLPPLRGRTVELALVAIGRMNAESVDPDTGSARDRPAPDPRSGPRAHRPDRHRDRPGRGADPPGDPRERARETMIGPAVERFRRVLRKGVERGELKAGPRRRPRRRRPAGQLLHLLLRARPPRAGVARRRRERALPGADGQGGIRTRDGADKPHTRLAGECLQPLGHLSRSPAV